MAKNGFSLWDMACRQLDAVAARMDLDPNMLARLRTCQRSLIVSVPVRTGEVVGGRTQILDGLKSGDQVVVEGAFALKSQLLKEEMGGGHGH